MKRIILYLLLFIYTTGWLVPLGLSFSFFNSWVNKIVIPKLNGTFQEMHSFPFYNASESTFAISFWWFSLSIISWSAYLLLYKPFKNSGGSNVS